jgi:hypothetical protein
MAADGGGRGSERRTVVVGGVAAGMSVAIDVAGGRVEQRDHVTGRDAREPFDAPVLAVAPRRPWETKEAA